MLISMTSFTPIDDKADRIVSSLVHQKKFLIETPKRRILGTTGVGTMVGDVFTAVVIGPEVMGCDWASDTDGKYAKVLAAGVSCISSAFGDRGVTISA